MTQKNFIRKYLNNGNTISPLAASEVFGIRNLRARINELRQEGFFVLTNRSAGVTQYELARPNKNFIGLAYKLAGGKLFRSSVTNG
jgi:hypothetical protein